MAARAAVAAAPVAAVAGSVQARGLAGDEVAVNGGRHLAAAPA